MNFKVMYRGLQVEADSIEALDALADRVSGVKTENQTLSKTRKKAASTGDLVRDFVNSLQPSNTSLLQVLMAEDVPITDKELREKCNLETNNQIGAILSAVTRAAKKVKFLEGKEIVTKVIISSKQGAKVFTYEIKEDVKEQLRDFL